MTVSFISSSVSFGKRGFSFSTLGFICNGTLREDLRFIFTDAMREDLLVAVLLCLCLPLLFEEEAEDSLLLDARIPRFLI